MSAREIIAVDIGNSGLKAAKIRLPASNIAGSDLSSIGELASHSISRLNWIDELSKPSLGVEDKDSASLLDSNDSLTAPASTADPNDWMSFMPWLKGWIEPSSSLTKEWWISSVQQAASESLRRALNDLDPSIQTRWVTYRDVPMKVTVDEPERLGIDRLLSGWMAWIDSPRNQPLIVIEAGTAVTVDWVSEKGAFEGGAILAGIPLALKLMASGTSQLPRFRSPEDFLSLPLPGKNTKQAMSIGAAASVLGGVAWIVQEYRRQNGENTPVIISGGDGPSVAHYVPGPKKIISHLVLRALGELARRSDFAGNP